MKKATTLFLLLLITQVKAQCWRSVYAEASPNTFAIRADGTLWAWGANSQGQLGIGTLTEIDQLTPLKIGTATDWKELAVGSHVLALKTDGTLWAWGNNNAGQLGDGTTTARYSPVQIGTATNWKTIASGIGHSLAIKTNGTLWAWGNNQRGQLGDGTNSNKSIPVQIGLSSDWKTITAGESFSLAIKTDGTLWSWGKNSGGQLGNATFIDQNIPDQVGIQSTWEKVSAGGFHVFATRSTGSLWSWGEDFCGSLGNGFNSSINIPFQYEQALNWQNVSAGFGHSLALRNTGVLWGCGWNFEGQVGNATNSCQETLVRIGLDVNNWQSVSAARNGQHSAGIRTDGTLWTWGANFVGQLGDGTYDSRNVPVQIGCSGLSIEKSNADTFSIVPNPAEKYLDILSTNNLIIKSIVIVDQTGKRVLEVNQNISRLDISMLQSGVYFIKINTTEKTYQKKFIKIN
jgi:alpha-tubulin suppressor-like RCC1 family protein